MHGVTLEVRADDPAVIEAMALRFCDLTGALDPAAPVVSFEFNSLAPPRLPLDGGRPVYETPHGSLHYFAADDLLAGELGGVALRCEPGAARATITAPAFRARTLYFAAHPVATVALMELMERREHFSLHAACLANADGDGLLVSGPSGAGKSTLTLALARAGMEFLGDDTVFLKRPARWPGAIRALGFADALGLGAFAAGRFPELAALAGEAPADGFPKRLHRFERLFGRPPGATCTPRVIVFPEVEADQPSTVTALDRGEALLRLVPDVLVTEARGTQAHIDVIAGLLHQVRCYRVVSGHDLEHAAALVRRLLTLQA